MNSLIEKYLQYVGDVRRYSRRTVQIYADVLEEFAAYSSSDPEDEDSLVSSITPVSVRNYEVHLLDERELDPRTVNLHVSVLSGFCRYLMMQDRLDANPVRSVTRPKTGKRLPEFYREEAMQKYFRLTAHSASEDELEILKSFGPVSGNEKTAVEMYERRLRRLVISILYSTGIRRAELISLDVGSVDMARRTARIKGKGGKTRMVPLIPELCDELSLYHQAAGSFFGRGRQADEPLLLTASGKRLYPVYVDRAVKEELSSVADITGRKSPHVLRHSIATGLLNEGTDIYSIKELLGHSSLAATQVYTHNSIEKLRSVYETAHPRAKK